MARPRRRIRDIPEDTDDIFAEIDRRLTPKAAKRVRALVQVTVGDEGDWFFDLRRPEAPWMSRSADVPPAAVVKTRDSETWRALVSGRTRPAIAAMNGRLSISGDIGCAMTFEAVLRSVGR